MIAVCHQSLAKGANFLEYEHCVGDLNPPPPPDGLEYHTAQAELICHGQTMGYVGENLPFLEASTLHRGLQNNVEDAHAWRECWHGFRYRISVMVNAVAEALEVPSLRF